MKPEPPADLWERIEEALNDLGGTRPANSFTKIEFIDRFKLSPSSAQRRIDKLLKAGMIERSGSSHHWYYTWKSK